MANGDQPGYPAQQPPNQYGQPYGQGQYGQGPGGPPQQRKTNGLAVASLVLGILWVCWVGSVLALIFGYMGKNQIDQSQGQQEGRGLAVAGIVLGWIGVAFLILYLVLLAVGAATFEFQTS